MHKYLKAFAVLATVAALSSPAAAQISGELTFKTNQFSSFSAFAALDYSLAVAPNAVAKFGLEYTLPFTTTSSVDVFAKVTAALGGGLGASLRADLLLNDIGASNSIGYLVTGKLFYLTSLLNQDRYYVDLYAELSATFNGNFGAGLELKIEGGYALAQNLGAYFGIQGDLGATVTPSFALAPTSTAYLELDYLLMNDMLKLFAGVDLGVYPFGFGDVYGGLRYQFSEPFAVKFLTLYNGASVTLSLSALYNR
jgi:hypothetical protein